MKFNLFLILCLLLPSMGNTLKAEKGDKKKSKVTLSTSFVSKHIWRGGSSGTAPCIEPSIEYNKGSLTLGTWGALSTDNSYQEVDLYIIYDLELFSIALYDYYCPDMTLRDSKFFNLERGHTKHTLDLQLSMKANNKIPISIMASVLFAGDDINIHNNNRYSMYLEFMYANIIAGKHFSWTLGATPYKGLYYDGANIVSLNMSVTDNLQLSNSFKLPIKAGLTLNPISEKMYLTFAFTL